ncbi:MAG TPA: methyltetrahydrofolate cobalamin methyltransferase [Desulfotomaculum sp.]|nr:methyltetrahydrofolate cobalamin methyltransferase [Desulfotomaculum sp.]
MLIIGELINATRKKVREAIVERDAAFLQDLAVRQAENGADYIDVNVATGRGGEQEAADMEWAVTAIQEAVDKPIAIDTADLKVLTAGLQAHKGRAMINSVSAEAGRLEPFLEVIRAYGGIVVALPIRESIPPTAAERVAVCRTILDGALAAGLNADDLYFDALVLPLSVDTANPGQTLQTIRELKETGVRTVIGLSNISFGLPERDLLNRCFLAMALCAGLDAAILNPLDRGIMATVFAAEALVGSDPMCARYLKAYRKGRLSG